MKLFSALTVIAIPPPARPSPKANARHAPKSKWQPKIRARVAASGRRLTRCGRSRSRAAATKSTPPTRTGKRANMAYNAETLREARQRRSGRKLSCAALGHGPRLGPFRPRFSLGARREFRGRLAELGKRWRACMTPLATSRARSWLCVVVWGFVGPRYARFAQFVRSPKTVIDYLRAIKDGSERRYVGHNPAGGAMIVVLLAAMAATAVSGWLLTTDAFWGSTSRAACPFGSRPRRGCAGGPPSRRRRPREPAPS